MTANIARLDVPVATVLAQLDPIESLRNRLPLTDPDRHALVTTTDHRFNTLAAHAQWGEAA